MVKPPDCLRRTQWISDNGGMSPFARKISSAALALPLMLTGWASPAAAANPAILAVIDPVPKTEFESVRRTRIQQELRACASCQILNLTPYDTEGRFDPAGLSRQLNNVPRENAVVLVLWNKRFEPKDQAVVDQIKGLANQGVLFVATAGRPEPRGPTLGLRRTLWGQTPQVVIIGELTERERLLPGTFFGPEMLTAIRPPSEAMGQDVAALMFSARLVSQLKQKKSTEWVDFLRNKKATSKRMWPTMDEFFGR